MHRLDPRIKTLWTVQYAVTAVVLSGLLFFYELFHAFDSTALPLPLAINSGVVLLTGLAIGAAAARLKFRFWRYELRDKELYLEHGVWNRIHTVVPLHRIQHLDVSQNLFEREWDLGRLVVYTAGTKRNSVILPGLSIDEARTMRDTIKQYVLAHDH